MNRPLMLVAALLAACSTLVQADVITLATGEKIEGKILSEDDESVRIEVKISASITDERAIPREEIASIDKPQPDAQSFAELAGIQIDPVRSRIAAWYEESAMKLEEFKAAFPSSANLAEVEARLAAIKAEGARVTAGDLKLGGKWFTKAEVESRGDELKGTALFEGMKAQAAAGDLAGAMATFDRIESEVPGVPAYPDAVALAQQILRQLDAAVARNLAAIASETKRVEKDLQMLSAPQQAQAKDVLAREKQRHERAVQSATGKWKPFIPKSPASMDAYKKMLPQEMRRLEALKIDGLRNAVAELERARSAMADGKFADAETALKQAETLWPKNSVLAGLRQELAKAKTAAQAKAEEAAAAMEAEPAEVGPGGKPKKGSGKNADAAGGEEKPFFMTLNGALVGLGGILAVVVLGTLAGKMRAKGQKP